MIWAGRALLVYWIIGLVVVALPILKPTAFLDRYRRNAHVRAGRRFDSRRGLAFYVALIGTSLVWPRIFRRR